MRQLVYKEMDKVRKRIAKYIKAEDAYDVVFS